MISFLYLIEYKLFYLVSSRLPKGIRMKLYIKTYLSEFIINIIFTCISIGMIYVILILNFFKLEGLSIINVLIYMSGPVLFIIGIFVTVVILKNMKKLKYFLENGIYTKAIITKLYPLTIKTSLEQEDESIQQEDESLSSIFTFSRRIQYQFQNKNNQIVIIHENVSRELLQYLCVGSKIHILYDPDEEEKTLICPLWDEWIANHELDAYPRFLIDVAPSSIIGKQRHIPFFHFFSMNRLMLTLVALSIIVIFFMIHTHQNPFWETIFPNIQESFEEVPTWVCFIGYGFGFLFLGIAYFRMKKQQKFFEYAVRTVALVQSAQVVERVSDEHSYNVVIVKYQFLSSTEDSIFHGSCELDDTKKNLQLQKGSEIEILYHAQKPNQNRCLTPKDEKYLYENK